MVLSDINECAQNSHECSHSCRNTDGSYKCQCPPDMVLKPDNRTCIEQQSLQGELQRDVPLSESNLKSGECADGFQWENGRCRGKFCHLLKYSNFFRFVFGKCFPVGNFF